jgi:hypothetical protein
MCDAPPPHDGTPPPPRGTRCPTRIDVEYHRWFSGHPMRPGQPRPVTLEDR